MDVPMDALITKPHTKRSSPTAEPPLVAPRRRARFSADDIRPNGPHGLMPDSPVAWDLVATGRRLAVFSCATLLSVLLIVEFYGVLSLGGLTLMEGLVLAFFGLNIFWIALAFVNALAGFAVLMFGVRAGPVSIADVPVTDTGHMKPPKGRTAILIATYNENPDRVFGASVAMLESLIARNAADAFDLFVISDTTDPEVWVQEEAAYLTARQQLGGQARLFYRRRPQNTGRKTGNLWQWLESWGTGYDYMLVLDADSVMTGETMVRMSATMDQNPNLGLLQTIPKCVGRSSIFARMQQFAASAYGPLYASGLAFWHRDASNFWGHNAILRTRAFMGAAKLPHLPGPPPLGGAILSHDFVEAAFLRRCGWQVVLTTELEGSYEESPPSIVDFALRDRRWCQGNLQHARLLGERGLHWCSRFHFITGIMSYVGAVFWLSFLVLGLILVGQAALVGPDYFPNAHSLFPNWPRQDSERAISLFLITMGVLLTPKILSLIWIASDNKRRRGFGGLRMAATGIATETLMSTLIAPIQMMFQSRAVWEVMSGSDSGWAPQVRDDGGISWSTAARTHRTHTCIGAGLTAVLLWISPSIWLWMSPICLGLMLSIPVSKWTSDYRLGVRAYQAGLFGIPAEHRTPAVIRRATINSQTIDLKRAGRSGLRLLSEDADLRRVHNRLLGAGGGTPAADNDDFDAVGLLVQGKLRHARDVLALETMLSREERLKLFTTPVWINTLGRLTPAKAKRQRRKAA